MLFDLTDYTCYVKPGATDSRKSWRMLSEIVESELNLDLKEKNLFLFCSKSRKCIKCLLWDNGYWILSKRLLQGTFSWPKDSKEAEKITIEELKMLLKGADVFRRIPEVKGKIIY